MDRVTQTFIQMRSLRAAGRILMARRRKTPEPPILVVLDVLAKIWLLLALWALFPLWSAILTQWLVGIAFGAMTHQAVALTVPQSWFIPTAVPWLLLTTVALVALWLFGVLSARERRAIGKRLDELMLLSPAEFEQWVGARFRERGYRVRNTGKSGDHGIDLVGTRGQEKIVIQCKRYAKRIRRGTGSPGSLCSNAT